MPPFEFQQKVRTAEKRVGDWEDLMETIKRFLFGLLTPNFWLMTERYDKHCDQWCMEALKSPTFTNVGVYRATMNGRVMWIENYPYGFEFTATKTRPSRLTIWRIRQALSASQWR